MVANHRFFGFLGIGLIVGSVAFCPMPASAIDIAKASMSNGEVVMQIVRYVQEQREKIVTATENGRTVEKTVVVVANVPVLEERTVRSGSITATDTAGKPIPADRLTGRLREPTLVVLGEVPVDKRGVFRDGTLFLQVSQDK